jgi:hypothetical protein
VPRQPRGVCELHVVCGRTIRRCCSHCMRMMHQQSSTSAHSSHTSLTLAIALAQSQLTPTAPTCPGCTQSANELVGRSHNHNSHRRVNSVPLRAWHLGAKSVENTMATMVGPPLSPYVNHIPTMIGGSGQDHLSGFYADHFIFKNPVSGACLSFSHYLDQYPIVSLSHSLSSSEWHMPLFLTQCASAWTSSYCTTHCEPPL